MIGAIAGDIIGSVYEHDPIKSKHFPLFGRSCCFTDDTVLTVAIAKAILGDGDYRRAVWETGRQYANAGYGASFIDWLRSLSPEPYGSWGNGAAMRVSPIGFAFDTVDAVLREAERSAEISHNHPEGIKGAQATALAVFLARKTHDKARIREEITYRFGYDLGHSVDDIRSSFSFDISCQGTVPQAIISFLESGSYEDAIRNAVSLGGDSDTLACITGGIAEAYYGDIPRHILRRVRELPTQDLWLSSERFRKRYGLLWIVTRIETNACQANKGSSCRDDQKRDLERLSSAALAGAERPVCRVVRIIDSGTIVVEAKHQRFRLPC
jgi:ADP-ribosylglycohydrolase